jgi:predicted esterase
MIRSFFVQLLLWFAITSSAQTTDILSFQNDLLTKKIETISKDATIHADSVWSILSKWNQYPGIQKTNQYYLFLYEDSVFGKIPLKIFIPENYKNTVPSPAVLLLHGAVVLSSFKDAYKDTTSDEDLFYNYFAKQGFIIIRPFADSYGPHADGSKNFDWVVNRFNGKLNRNKINPTFNSLVSIVNQVKKLINIDDDKVFAFGHSDGSDGAFALEIYKPSVFAGFIVYNSMLTNIFSYNIYLKNSVNRSLYLVHSDLDDLRPIQQTRTILKILDSLQSPHLYKEYLGYKHYDKHLQIDLPYSHEWIKNINRNPFQQNLYWETSDSINTTCDWLRILKFDTSLTNASWHTEVNTASYNKKDKVYMNSLYYRLNKSAAVKASYSNNTFDIHTSRCTEIEILISPVMVNLENPVTITINGKQVFKEKIVADKWFLINNFNQSFDRRALWVTSISLKCE